VDEPAADMRMWRWVEEEAERDSIEWDEMLRCWDAEMLRCWEGWLVWFPSRCLWWRSPAQHDIGWTCSPYGVLRRSPQSFFVMDGRPWSGRLPKRAVQSVPSALSPFLLVFCKQGLPVRAMPLSAQARQGTASHSKS